MTPATQTLLAHLAQHVGDDAAKKSALRSHVLKSSGRALTRSSLHDYLNGHRQPTMDFGIPILRWMQLQGLLVPGKKTEGLFLYTQPLKQGVKVTAVAEKQATKPAKGGTKKAAGRA